eukprot:jgi/Undpi1/12783/HiC_scaffold_6.g02451.m1
MDTDSDSGDDGDYETLGLLVVAFASFAKRKHNLSRTRTVATWEILMREHPDSDGEEEGTTPRMKRTRRVFPRSDYNASAWGQMLRCEALNNHQSAEAKLFRRRFRVPYVFFLQLVIVVKDRGWFKAGPCDAAGRPSIPVELKVLTALQVLSRGNCFDDIKQLSLISESMAQATFHKFCSHFARELYDEHIRVPVGADKEKVMDEYNRLGLTGAIGSTDVTHIRWGCCTHSLSHSYTGKEGFPTIAYQATVDHSGRALAITQGFPGAQNDKTIIRHDTAINAIRQDPMYTDDKFFLYAVDGTEIEQTGNYVIVDNGYLPWGSLVAPMKCPLTNAATAWSKRLESVRKDVECFFGVLKGRFRILKLPILYRNKDEIDNMFFCCCILHNMLHAMDGLDTFEAGVEWAGADGDHDTWAHDPYLDVSSFGNQGAECKDREEEAHRLLTDRLIAHYDYRNTVLHDVEWLSRPWAPGV